LTFLYGPNSAGKSSIFDALSFIEAVFKSDHLEVRQMIERWTHISNTRLASEPQKGAEIYIGVKFVDLFDLFQNGTGYQGPDWRDLPDEFRNSNPFMQIGRKNINEKEESNEFEIQIKTYGFTDYLSITLIIHGVKIFRISLGEDDDPNDYEGRFDDYILELFSDPFGDQLDNLAIRHGEFAAGKTSYKMPCHLRLGPIKLDSPISHYSVFESDLLSIANFILKCLGFLTFSQPNVSSDRSTLLNQNLVSFQYTSITVVEPKSRITLAPNFVLYPLQNLSSGVIAQLTGSKFQEQKEIWTLKEDVQANTEWDTTKIALVRAFEREAISRDNENPDVERLHTFVNRCLSEHLFLDQGYQLTYDVCRVLPSELSGSTNDQVFAALIVCALIDNAGRSLTFEDVGTGISCVLPVLTALYAQESFIQQPELHLHPALQSALADILVERAKSWGGSARHIIETHSEYLLLRCLRRIRETTLGKQLPNSPLSLSKEDVSVLYFDPQPDGTTTVKQLRVSTQGDFIDRWPRGFFDERAKDIFDE
jgi:AAA15 family ATPase/GTPase